MPGVDSRCCAVDIQALKFVATKNRRRGRWKQLRNAVDQLKETEDRVNSYWRP